MVLVRAGVGGAIARAISQATYKQGRQQKRRPGLLEGVEDLQGPVREFGPPGMHA